MSELEALLGYLDKFEAEKRRVEEYEEWQRTSLLAALIANPYRDIQAHPDIIEPVEFMPPCFQDLLPKPEEPERKSWEDMKRVVEQKNKALGGKDTRERR